MQTPKTCWTITSQESLDKMMEERRALPEEGPNFCAHIDTAEPLHLVKAHPGVRFDEVALCYPYTHERRKSTLEVHGGTLVTEDSYLTVKAYGIANNGEDCTRVIQWAGTTYAYEHVIVNAYRGAVFAKEHVVIYASQYRGSLEITGGIVIPHDRDNKHWGSPTDKWLADYDLEADDNGVVIVYKAVNSFFLSEHGESYEPGSTPVAPDWLYRAQCGNGLHFSPRPYLTRRYTHNTTLLGCPVRVDEMVVLGDKVKAKRVVDPGCFLVDIHGRPIDAAKRRVRG